MDWDSNIPLKLLSRMPARLTKANLEAIQKVIDNDKYICSTLLNRDLCREYAPFCALCDKSMRNPCAVAYIRMRQAEDIQYEIAIAEGAEDETTEVVAEEPSAVEPHCKFGENPLVNVDENNNEVESEPEVIIKDFEDEEVSDEMLTDYMLDLSNESSANTETVVVEESEEPQKKILRIAVAKRKK